MYVVKVKAVSRDNGYESIGHHASNKEIAMITTFNLCLAGLMVCAIILVSFLLAFLDGAKTYEQPDIKRELHSNPKGKDVFYRSQSSDE